MFNVTQKFVYFNIKILKHYWKLMVDTVLLKSGNNFAFSFFLQRMTITLHNIACKDGLVKLLCCVIDLFNPFQSSVTFLYPCDTGLKWVKYFCQGNILQDCYHPYLKMESMNRICQDTCCIFSIACPGHFLSVSDFLECFCWSQALNRQGQLFKGPIKKYLTREGGRAVYKMSDTK